MNLLQDFFNRKADTPAYDELMDAIFDPEERSKLERAIGSASDVSAYYRPPSLVIIHGGVGSGKSTVLHIIESIFEGKYSFLNLNPSEDYEITSRVVICHGASPQDLVLETFPCLYRLRNGKHVCIDGDIFMATNAGIDENEKPSDSIIHVTTSGRRLPFDRYLKLIEEIETSELFGIINNCFLKYAGTGTYMDDLLSSWTEE